MMPPATGISVTAHTPAPIQRSIPRWPGIFSVAPSAIQNQPTVQAANIASPPSRGTAPTWKRWGMKSE